LKQELIGQQFERLLVISKAGRNKYGEPVWLCRCNCGVEKNVRGYALKSGNTKSCGCLHREKITTHGNCEIPEFNIWRGAKQRCTNPKNRDFPNYGGRGVKFLFDDFKEFLAHIGPRPGKEYSLDRIDNSGNYEHGNVRWATPKTQCRNTRSNRLITYQNETLCLAGWAEKLNMNKGVICSRLRNSWSVKKALSTPTQARTFQP
jgi:hypothetical protein